MFKELLKHSQVGGKVEINYILFDILSSSTFKDADDIKLQCLHYSYSFGSCFNGTIALLKALGYIIAENERFIKNLEVDNYTEQSLFESGFFLQSIVKLLVKNDEFSAFFNSDTVKFNPEKGSYYLRDSYIPIKHSIIKKILVNTGLLLKDSNVRSIFIINQAYFDFFALHVVDRMQSIVKALRIKRKLSLNSLKKQLERQEELGLQAEVFVLSYEKQRLSKHPLASQIVRISDDYSNAGYDIESFNDVETILINRFIEVKSYTGDISFFWSSNEIETAKNCPAEYFLYLINRDEMQKPKYQPLIIPNPYKNVFQNLSWKRKVGQYLFSQNDNGGD